MGRVPSGWASFTSAPARIFSSAALRFPVWIRFASAAGVVCADTAVITQTAVRIKRFMEASLHNVAVQFVVVRPHSLGRVVQKLVWIFPGSREIFQYAAF